MKKLSEFEKLKKEIGGIDHMDGSIYFYINEEGDNEDSVKIKFSDKQFAYVTFGAGSGPLCLKFKMACNKEELERIIKIFTLTASQLDD